MSDQQSQRSWWLDAGDFLHILNFLHNQVSNVMWLHLIISGTCLILLPQSLSAGLIILGTTLIWLTSKNQETAKSNHDPKDRDWLNTLTNKASQAYQTCTQKPWYQLIICLAIIWGTGTSLYAFCGLVSQNLGFASHCAQIILFYLSACCMIGIQQYKNTQLKNNHQRTVLENLQYYSMQPYFALTTTLTITSIVTSLLFTNVTLLWLTVILVLAAIIEHQHRQAKSDLSSATTPTNASNIVNQIHEHNQTHQPEKKPTPPIASSKKLDTHTKEQSETSLVRIERKKRKQRPHLTVLKRRQH